MASKANYVNDLTNLPIPGASATLAELSTTFQTGRATWWCWSTTPGFPHRIWFGRAVQGNSEPISDFLVRSAHSDNGARLYPIWPTAGITRRFDRLASGYASATAERHLKPVQALPGGLPHA